jgi:hypothetical protein
LQGIKGDKGEKGETGATGATGTGYSGVSSTSTITIGTGLKTFTLVGGYAGAYITGDRVRAIHSDTPTYYMEGYANYVGGGTIIITVDVIAGSGSHNNWNFSIAGIVGATGATGSSGVIAVNAPLTNAGTSTSANLSVSAGSTSAAGVLQLTDSTSSTSTTTAATPNAVKTAYDFAAGTVMPFVSGLYYRGPMAASVASTSTAVANTTYYMPFFVSTATTFDRIQARAGSTFSGSAVVRLGIYGSTGGKPSTLILDAGTISLTATFQSGVITISQTLQPGIYWLAANSQTAATSNIYYGPIATGTIGFINQPVDSGYATIIYYSQTGVTGAFANAGTLVNGTTNGGITAMLRAQ